MDVKRYAFWRTRPAAVAAGVAAVLAVIIGLFTLNGKGAADRSQAAGEQSAVIQPRPFAATLSLAGAVTPGAVVAVTAPFEGVVKAVYFEFGAAVDQGQALVELDTADIEQRRDAAQSEFLKASQEDANLAAWTTGPEMAQARRSEAAAAFDLADTQRKIVETKALLDRGLVARDEYDSVLQQKRGQEMALAAARQEMADTLKRGSGANRRVAELDLKGAAARLAQVDAERAGSIVRAPAAGVIVHASGDKLDSAAPSLHPGQSLTRGQMIAAIAKPGGLAVSFALSESDANRVRPGQAVAVSGPGFQGMALHGTVASVAREATPASAGGAAVSFAASARLDELTPAQAAVIRIGMTANVTVDLYRNPNALVAPPAAIQGETPDTFVVVKDPRGGRPRRVAVRIGQVAPDGVEVLSGLRPGDVVLWSGSAAAHSDDDN